LSDLIECVLDKSGYRKALRESGADEDSERLANIEELLTAAGEFEQQNPETDNLLELFLEQSSLVADTDALDTATERVTLMTMHAAKGLEFPVVFIVATEQRLLPHERSLETQDQLEEERRLLFVGMTRAEEELQLSLAQYRSFRGEGRPAIPSQFLMELPREEMRYEEPSSFHFDDEDSDDDYSSDPGFDDVEAFADVDAEDQPAGKRPLWSDDDFVQDASEPFPDQLAAKLVPASRLERAPQGETRRYSPHIFQQGMLVSHPEYGTGTIVLASGTGVKRKVRVQFDDSGEAHSFVLIHSPLEPLLGSR
jgi:DNA helicase-2/ATP-dependent DNA helicase PcrA